MNPFHSLSTFFVDRLPADAPEWAIGTAIMAGVFIPLLAILAVGAMLGWLIGDKS